MQKSFYNSSYRSLDFSGFQMKKGIGTKWLLRKKKDEEGIMLKIIARSWLHMGTHKKKEEVYVCQPPGFEDPDFPNRVYKVEKIGIGVNAGDSKLMLLGINLLLLMKVNVAKHKLTAARKRIILLVLGKVNDARHKLTTTVKTINGEVQLQALVDGKKIIVTEASVRRDLQLNDEEGAKTTAWNEFSSTMASAIICLATNQKFNFSKYIFESMVKNLDNAGKFLMYPRLGFNEEMDDVWKGLPLLLMALMREQDRETYGGIQLLNLRRSENVSKLSNDLLLARGNTLQSGEDRLKLQELMELCTNLQNRVIDLENTKTAQAQEITSLKLRVKKLEKKGGSRTHKLKRLYKVGRSARIVSSDEASLGDQEDASKQGRKIDDIDKDAEITLVDETQGRYGDDIMFDVSDLAGEEVFVAEQGVPDSKKDDAAQVNTAAITVSTASTIC
ncbi:hypothetical protein Tco_0122546 [Tanacetum coccineum]